MDFNVQTIFQTALRQYVLHQMPAQERRERLMMPYMPAIPKDAKIKAVLMRSWYDPAFDDHDALHAHLVDSIDFLGLSLNKNLPPDFLQREVRLRLEDMDDEERLEKGVFGKPWTKDDAEGMIERYVTLTTGSTFDLMATVSESEVSWLMQEPITSTDPSLAKRIANIFPAGVQKLTHGVSEALIVRKNRDIIKLLQQHSTAN